MSTRVSKQQDAHKEGFIADMTKIVGYRSERPSWGQWAPDFHRATVRRFLVRLSQNIDVLMAAPIPLYNPTAPNLVAEVQMLCHTATPS